MQEQEYRVRVYVQVRLLLLAALAGEHLLLLGPPGTAKSELSRRLSKLTGGKYFERLLTRFSVPEVRLLIGIQRLTHTSESTVDQT